MKVYVVIPHYNNWTLTHARLWELYKYCGESIQEVVVVDDCSTDELTNGGLEWWKSTFESKYNFKVTSIRTDENVGFLRASNFGLSDTLSKCEPEDIIILLSNDVEVRTNFISQVMEILSHGVPSLVGGILYSTDTGWNKFGDNIFSYLEGWLLAARAMDWITLELFDPIFTPSDYEDMDLSTLALKYGYELVPLNNPGLHHIGGQSIHYGEERLKRTNENKKKFEEKWIK